MTTPSSYLLPRVKNAKVTQNPRKLVIMSKPKVGKTTLLSELNGCLTIDLQNGGDFLEIMSVKASDYRHIYQIADAIRAEKYPYPFIAVDTGTDLEEMAVPLGEQIYAGTSMGAGWFDAGKGKAIYGSLLNMPNGAGYQYLRQAFEQLWTGISQLAPYSIMCCHIKDTVLDDKGKMVEPMSIDLTGKIKRTVAADADAIGYLYRKGNQNILSFKTTDEVICGARPDHLRNQEIVISEYDPATGKVTTHWDRIYLPEPLMTGRPLYMPLEN